MPRKLPWLAKTKSKRPLAENDASSAKRRKQHASDGEESELYSTPRVKRKARVSNYRNPSSSPPPVPPTPEFMKDGYDNDDKWIMVEDEFLETAKQFTRHLHHAEYQRLKLLAKEQKTSRGGGILLPVGGMALMESLPRKGAEDKRLKSDQQKTIRRAAAEEDSEEWEDGTWASNPRFAGLMVRKGSTKLSSSVGLHSSTLHPNKEEDFTRPEDEQRRADPPQESISSSPPSYSIKPRSIHRKPVISSQANLLSDTVHGRYKLPEPHSNVDDRRQKQRNEREQKSVKLEEIPTFLI